MKYLSVQGCCCGHWCEGVSSGSASSMHLVSQVEPLMLESWPEPHRSALAVVGECLSLASFLGPGHISALWPGCTPPGKLWSHSGQPATPTETHPWDRIGSAGRHAAHTSEPFTMYPCVEERRLPRAWTMFVSLCFVASVSGSYPSDPAQEGLSA